MIAIIHSILAIGLCITLLFMWLDRALTLTAKQRSFLLKAVNWDEKKSIGIFDWKYVSYWVYTPEQSQTMFNTVSLFKHLFYVVFCLDPFKLYPQPLQQRVERYRATPEGKEAQKWLT